MSREAVAQALEAMDDEGVRSSIEGGDLSALEGLDLADDEHQMVVDAAADYPDVSGFAAVDYFRKAGGDAGKKYDAYLKLDGIKLTDKFNVAVKYGLGF